MLLEELEQAADIGRTTVRLSAAERCALWWYRLRGWRILDTKCLGRRQRARPDRAPRP
jgi:hypothetical protein